MIMFQYYIKTGKKLNLDNPTRFTEKLQWYKLYYKNPLMIQCVDKYDVREYVSHCGCSGILNDLYGVFESVDDINFESLPDRFVCKDTLASGSTSVIIFDKQTDDIYELKRKMQKWIETPYNKKHPGREWPYDNRRHRIIIEKELQQLDGDLADYKFFCFSGKVHYFYIRTGYAKNHENGEMAFFDDKKQVLKGVHMDYCNPSMKVPKLPDEIDEMIHYAECLSEPFPHVRVDLYNVDGNIIFGELTFFNASGYMRFIPDEWDYKFGESFFLKE